MQNLAAPSGHCRNCRFCSLQHYASGEIGMVEIESQWTARRRERAGIFLQLKELDAAKNPAQAELGRGTLRTRGAG
jgi:hypothetical protein